MHKNLLGTLLVGLIAFSGTATAAGDWYLGQTGQYHKLPEGQDVQKITLRAEANGACPNVLPNAMTFYAVDEYGKTETIPFTVPSKTVFLATDVIFTGIDTLGLTGYLPWLNIAQSNVSGAFAKMSAFATHPLSGKSGEQFVGERSLASGAAFAANSVLCAYPGVYTDTFGTNYYPSMNLTSVIVQGTLIDNIQTNAPPYFDW